MYNMTIKTDDVSQAMTHLHAPSFKVFKKVHVDNKFIIYNVVIYTLYLSIKVCNYSTIYIYFLLFHEITYFQVFISKLLIMGTTTLESLALSY